MNDLLAALDELLQPNGFLRWPNFLCALKSQDRLENFDLFRKRFDSQEIRTSLAACCEDQSPATR